MKELTQDELSYVIRHGVKELSDEKLREFLVKNEFLQEMVEGLLNDAIHSHSLCATVRLCFMCGLIHGRNIGLAQAELLPVKDNPADYNPDQKVHEMDGAWWFWTDDGQKREGPFVSEKAARESRQLKALADIFGDKVVNYIEQKLRQQQPAKDDDDPIKETIN